MSIRLVNISKTFTTLGRRRTVFRNFSLEIPKGLNLGVIGPNGSGKSTLLTLLAGGMHPDSGAILRKMTVSWPIGYSGGVSTTVSGVVNCRFLARLYGKDPQKIVDFVSEFTELGEYMTWPVKTYSSGMRSRLNFALSMAIDFDCTLVDEGMGAGDQFFRAKAEALIEERRKRSSFVMVTHNLTEVVLHCDKVLVLGGSEPELCDNVEERVNQYIHDMTSLREQSNPLLAQPEKASASL
ncbi:MAG TPA: ATP-binding cassette domain-containing protein [Caulobacteraceae bacterium]